MQRPNSSEIGYLTLAYNKFYDIFDEVMNDNFWDSKPSYRLARIKDVYGIYAELLNYEPIKWTIDQLRTSRPPMEAEIGSEVFKFVRNVFAHFPFFDTWDEVYVSRQLVNWHKPGQSIDKFMTKYQGHDPVKYRYWQPDIKKMTYVSINFPDSYKEGGQIYLRDIIFEREGVPFSMILMRQVIDTQVESVSDK